MFEPFLSIQLPLFILGNIYVQYYIWVDNDLGVVYNMDHAVVSCMLPLNLSLIVELVLGHTSNFSKENISWKS
jgi:hypothetical protein